MDEPDRTIIALVTKKLDISVSVEPKRYMTGIVHRVYDLEKYIIKIEGDYSKTLEHQGEILNKLKALGAKVPGAVDFGIIEGKAYLVMEKLEGKNIVYDWVKMSLSQKEQIIAELAYELQIYHSMKFDIYAIPIASGTSFKNFQDANDRLADFSKINKAALAPSHRQDVEYIEDYYRQHRHLLSETETAVLVHNDIHLENIFHAGEHITGIVDFDWCCQAPKDYELWKIIEVVREPKLTVEGKLEPLYDGCQMITELGFLKKYYPDLFAGIHVAERIRLFYLSNKLFNRIEDFQKEGNTHTMDIVHEEISMLFKSQWLESLLG